MPFRLPGGCWMTKWQSAFPCPASPACSITTAPHHQVNRSPTRLMIESSPFVLTTRSHPDSSESSQNLLQGRRSRVRMKSWAGDRGKNFDSHDVGITLLLQVNQIHYVYAGLWRNLQSISRFGCCCFQPVLRPFLLDLTSDVQRDPQKNGQVSLRCSQKKLGGLTQATCLFCIQWERRSSWCTHLTPDFTGVNSGLEITLEEKR